jgi:hypothetical protein
MASGACLVLALATTARADEYEARWSARPVGGLALMQEGGAEPALAFAGGASIAMAYGLTNRLDLGAELFSMRVAPVFTGDMSVNGDSTRGPFERRTSTILLLVGPTWRFGSPDGWTPVLALSTGGGVRHRSIGVFSDIHLMPPEKTAANTLDLAVAVKAGFERRIDQRWTIGAYLSSLVAGGQETRIYAMASLSVGLSYVYYPPW